MAGYTKKRMRAAAALVLGFCALFFFSFAAYASIDYESVRAQHESGQLVFDGADLFSDAEQTALQQEASALKEKVGFDCVIFTTDDADGYTDTEQLANEIFYQAGFGQGEDGRRSGTMLLIDMENRAYYLYSSEEAGRYLTDSAVEYICDEEVGPALSDGDYAEAAEDFLSDVEVLYENGVEQDQYDYNAETGKRDYYYPQHSMSFWKIIAAALVSAVMGILPCSSVKKNYAMEAEKQLSQGFSLAYQNGAAFRFTDGTPEAKLVNSFVTSIPIAQVRQASGPRDRGGHGGGRPVGGFGGGRTTMHSNGHGGSYSGRGGRF